MGKALARHRLAAEVVDERRDDNGYWVYLIPGWRSTEGTHQVHEDTVTRCLAELRFCEECFCDECIDLTK